MVRTAPFLAFTLHAALSATVTAAPIQGDYGFRKEQLAPVGGVARELYRFQSVNSLPHWYAEHVDVVGDVSGDGLDDFAIHNPGASLPEVTVYSGGTGLELFSLPGNGLWDHGFAGVGDMDGDGLDDVAIALDLEVIVYSSATLVPIHIISMGGNPSPAGDLNGDGVQDLLICCGGSSSQSESFAFSGSDGQQLRVFDGGADRFLIGGRSVAVLGDLNGDGGDDLLIANHHEPNLAGDHEAGVVRVYSGKDGVELHYFEGSGAGDEFGLAVAALPDADGDGLTDFLISEGDFGSSLDARSTVRAYSSASGNVLFELQGNPGDRFGVTLDVVPDLDRDGVAEILVGAPWRSDRPWWWQPFTGRDSYQGAAVIYSGATLEQLHRVEQDDRRQFLQFGSTVRGMSDLNGDGRGEFLVAGLGFEYGLWFVDSSVSIMSFNPQLFLSDREVSATVGGTIGFELDFSDDPIAASQPYKVLMSGLRGSQTDHLGIGVPLARDGLFERTYQGVYPFPRSGPMHGVLDANGKRSFQLSFAPGQLTSAIGLTYSFAAVIEPVAGQAIASSSAVTFKVLP